MDEILPQAKVVAIQNKQKVSTIKLSNSTKERLDHLQLYPRETYEEILIRILDILNTTRQSPDKARAKLLALDRQRRMNFKEDK
ncbi:MAG: hypothetical protein AABX11_04510 [Nanoarchaeota archaeon]